MVKPELKELIERFITLLCRKGIRVEKVILYGSFVSGNIHEGSDIDLAIVSPDFGKDRYEEGKLLFQIAWRVDPRIEPVPISSESYKKDTWLPLIHAVREKGVEIRIR